MTGVLTLQGSHPSILEASLGAVVPLPPKKDASSCGSTLWAVQQGTQLPAVVDFLGN